MHATCSKVCGTGNLSSQCERSEPVHGRRQRAKRSIPTLSWGPWGPIELEVFICHWYHCVKKQRVKMILIIAMEWSFIKCHTLQAVRTSHAEIEHQEESLPELVLKTPWKLLWMKNFQMCQHCCPERFKPLGAVHVRQQDGVLFDLGLHGGWHPWTQISPTQLQWVDVQPGTRPCWSGESIAKCLEQGNSWLKNDSKKKYLKVWKWKK